MAELQVIVLALECVPLNSFIVVYLDSQAALDVCVVELALTSSNFCNHCWMVWCGIVNFIKKKRLDVFWCKIKKHLGVLNNKCADVLAGLATGFNLVLSVLIEKKFIKTGGVAVSSALLPSASCCVKAFV
ncbi:hypothetical protein G9A89_003404 [Geosiphon pyriformis]|nr:hypothetical protein G9A89_003404 [Geosiphon pyriformis]